MYTIIYFYLRNYHHVQNEYINKRLGALTFDTAPRSKFCNNDAMYIYLPKYIYEIDKRIN
jgi:predicted GH43/DUF377 family glycosyl hydrolase